MTLEISALGFPLIIRRDGRAIPKIPKKAQAVLVYLAQGHGRLISRDRIADLLWPDQHPDASRHCLRNCLHDFRKAVGASAFLRGFHEIRLDTVDIDTARLEEAAGTNNASAIAALYRGPFLDDFDLPSEPWNEWLTFERDRLQSIAVQALDRVAMQALAENSPAAAIAAAQRILEIDRLYEPAHCHIIAAHRDCGRRAAAVRQYRECATLLEHELGVVPAEATTEAVRGLSAIPTPMALSRSELRTECRRLGREGQAALAGKDGRKPGRRAFAEMAELLIKVADAPLAELRDSRIESRRAAA